MDAALQLAPSLLAADFSRLREEVGAIDRGGAGWVHLDVMDGVFVPNLTLGPFIVEAVRRCTSRYLDAHLMIVEPDRHLEAFARAGVQGITVHYEAAKQPAETLQRIRALGCRAGISVKPGTPAEVIAPLLPLADLVLVMTVEPGFGGQKILPANLDKVRRVRSLAKEAGTILDVQVDGGVILENIGEVVRAGANVVVAGSAIFKGGQPEEACREFLRVMRAARRG